MLAHKQIPSNSDRRDFPLGFGLLALCAEQALACAPLPLKTVRRTVFLRGFKSL
jgi:hypothetical protein